MPAPSATELSKLLQRQAAQVAALQQKPVVFVNYGLSKIGKSTDLLFSFSQALFVGDMRSLRPSIKTVGWAPLAIEETTDLAGLRASARKYIRVVNGKPAPGCPTSIILDDFSLAAKRTQWLLESRFSGWDLWGEVNKEVLSTLYLLTVELRVNVGITAHIRYPKDKMPGGPDLPTEKLSLELPKHCDVVALAEPDAFRKPWPAVYKIGLKSAPGWVTGAWIECPPVCPMNAAEIFRSAGKIVDRAPSMEWAEEVVQTWAGFILQGNNKIAVLTDAAKRLRGLSIPDWQIAWVVRDIQDRAEIIQRSPSASCLANFGITL